MSSVEIELARRQWEEGSRRLDESAADRARQVRLLAALEAVTDELRRRIGQTFTLAELAAVYARAEDWVREAIEEHAPFPGWPAEATTVQDAAFHQYARGATDYEP
jgi:hypothetical protein